MILSSAPATIQVLWLWNGNAYWLHRVGGTMYVKVLCKYLVDPWRVSSHQLDESFEEEGNLGSTWKTGKWPTLAPGLTVSWPVPSELSHCLMFMLLLWPLLGITFLHLYGPTLSTGYCWAVPHSIKLSDSILCNHLCLLLASSSSSWINSAASCLSIFHSSHSFFSMLIVSILVQALITSHREWERFQRTRLPPNVERFINRVWRS